MNKIIESFSNRLHKAMELRGLKSSQIEKVSEQLYAEKKIKKVIKMPIITDYLKGRYEAKQSNIYALAMILNVSEAWLMGADVPMERQNKNNIDINTDKRIYACPVYGRISAGQPNWAEECIEGRIPIDPELMNIINPEECYFLRVNGESMNQLVKNGAFALIRKTDFVKNGDVAVVLVNGHDATLKKFSKQVDLVVLEPMSNDSSFTTQVYSKNTDVKIIGKYIGKLEMN